MKNKQIHITAKCPVRTTMELIGGKWKLLILHQLFDGPYRLSKLKSLIPDISEKMLIQELKTMVVSGLVSRKNFGEVPPRVEYSLTEKGKHVQPLLAEIAAFAQRYQKESENKKLV